MEDKKSKIERTYFKYYKILMFIPIVILVISLLIVGIKYARTGDFFDKDVSLKGGVTVTIYISNEIDINSLENDIKNNFINSDVDIRRLGEFATTQTNGITIEVSDVKEEDLRKFLETKLNIKLNQENYSAEETGPSLGQSFYKELIIAIIFAFILMSIVVLITFRTFIPSIAVIFAAFTDIMFALAMVNLLGMKISSGGVVAFLMLIGFSIDTDILLTTRVIKRREGALFERMFSAFKTGITMTLTAIFALAVAYFVTNSEVLRQIFLIIVIGLIMDIFSTWFTNTGMLVLYCKKKNIT